MADRPLYALLADDLRRDIRAGKWKVGDLLPTEKELARQTLLSRATVRAALQQLVDYGLVSRHKAVGTRVREVAEPGSFATATSSMEELVQFDLATRRLILATEVVVADDELARRMSCRPGSSWVRITTVRTNPSSPKHPIGWTQIYLDRQFEYILPKLEGHKGLVAALLLEEGGVEMDKIDQIICPTIVNSEVGKILDVSTGSPALEITRRYVSRDAIVIITFSVHPADRFSYRIALKRERPREKNDLRTRLSTSKSG